MIYCLSIKLLNKHAAILPPVKDLFAYKSASKIDELINV